MTRWILSWETTPRLILLSILLGLIGGFGALIFLWMLHIVAQWLLTPLSGYRFLTVHEAAQGVIPPQHWFWLLPLATGLGGLLAGLLVYSFAPEAEGHGTDAAVRAFHLGQRIRGRIPLVKSVASALTIGSGGSAGREGPTAQIAAGLGSVIGGLLELPEEEQRILILAGMAAGLSGIFKSPLGTAIFAVEILYSSMAFESGALVYTILSAGTAYALVGIFDGWTPLFILPPTAQFQAINLPWYAVLGLLAGLLGAIYPGIFYGVRDAFRRLRLPPHLKPALGGLAVGLGGILLPQLLGGGYGWMELALEGRIAIGLALLLALGKIVALSLTIGSGGSGGVFAPSLYIGAMLGAGMAGLLHLILPVAPNPTAFAVVGMAALFAGAARVPIANLIMVTEMTGGYQLILPTMLAVAIAFIIQERLTRHARYPTLYEAQVPRPTESPAHRKSYYELAAHLLRQGVFRLDPDLLSQELQEELEQGTPIPLAGEGNERTFLYSIPLDPNSPLAGRRLSECNLKGILIVGILREGQVILPHGGTHLQQGDLLLVASRPHELAESPLASSAPPPS